MLRGRRPRDVDAEIDGTPQLVGRLRAFSSANFWQPPETVIDAGEVFDLQARQLPVIGEIAVSLAGLACSLTVDCVSARYENCCTGRRKGPWEKAWIRAARVHPCGRWYENPGRRSEGAMTEVLTLPTLSGGEELPMRGC
ncbi:unnamed protein product, partial [Iphiclides podalirius]